MEKAGIADGDLIRCARGAAKDGDIVYAELEGGRKTLARYREEGGEIRLYSETDDVNFAPYVRVAPNRMCVLGIFIEVVNWV